MIGGFPDGVHPDAATLVLMANEIYRVMHLPRPQIVLNGFQLAINSGYTWQWYRDGDTVATALGGRQSSLPSFQPGTYKCAVQIDSVLEHILVTNAVTVFAADIQEAATQDAVLFPLPTYERLFWNLQSFENASIEVRVLDVQGSVLSRLNSQSSTGHIGTESLPSGFYFIEFIGGEASIRRIFWKR